MRRLAALAAIAAAGCADPYATDPKEAPPKRPAGEEFSKPVKQAPDRAIASATPEAAARRAAELAGNWTSATIAARHHEFARNSVGAARDQAQKIAASAVTDPALSKPGAKSIAIVHAATATGTGPRRRVIVVTHETLVADGLRHARWRVTITEAVRHGDGWTISRWEPQP